MKVTILATGETADFNNEYAARLIEQGKAVLMGDEKQGVKRAEAPKTETATGVKKK